MKKRRLGGMVLACLLAIQVPTWAADEMQPLEYTCTIAPEKSDFETGEWKYAFCVADLPMEYVQEGEKHTFLICDGQYLDIPVRIIQDTAFISASALTEGLGCKVVEKAGSVSLIKGSKKLTVSTENGGLDESKMLALRDVAEALGAEVTYTRMGVAPLHNPIISVDFRPVNWTEEEALEHAKEVLTACLQAGRESGAIIEHMVAEDPVISAGIAKEIAAMEPAEEVMAGYYLLNGPGLILVEKDTGEVYKKYGGGTAGHGSYVETIEKVEAGDASIFAAGYYLG
ncbi:MAG TPA: copper amine oxidase N-terminal domain-containing protein [Candidatus Anaerotignum merdipullorum]|nr:copper amine oxidase N-terminal domain-containing protein [Candidatus Anaerotignum merdipullorum]